RAPALVVPSIDQLEHAGLVERTRDPTDRRRSRVRVTQEGSNALARGDVIADRVVAHTLQGLDNSERAELARLLQKGVRPQPPTQRQTSSRASARTRPAPCRATSTGSMASTSRVSGSNRRHLLYKRSALPTELTRRRKAC